jgi:hypothetical protein
MVEELIKNARRHGELNEALVSVSMIDGFES